LKKPDSGRRLGAVSQQAVDHFMRRPVAAHGDHQTAPRPSRQSGGVSGLTGMNDVEIQFAAGSRAGLPESAGPAITGNRIDDD
jgi:hypothetical protein